MLITISNRYGCGALEIARRVADGLGCELVDEQLPVVVAKRLRTSAEAVERAEDTVRTMSERMVQMLELATPELSAAQGEPSFDQVCLREVQEAVRQYAARGNAVIFGRGANAILGRRPGVLRVFMDAPLDWRLHRVMETHGVDERVARSEITRVDRMRTQYMRFHYDLDWGDLENYDLALDTSAFGVEGSAAIILAAARSR